MEIIRNSRTDDATQNDASSFTGVYAGHDRVQARETRNDGLERRAPVKDGEEILRSVTNIKPALRDTHRVNIFIDGKFSFSLDLAQLADCKLKVGQQLTKTELTNLISASNFGKLYQRALEYAFLRPRSVKEMREHLRKKQHSRQLQARRYAEFQEKLKTDPDFREKVSQSRQQNREFRTKLRNQGKNYTIDDDGGYTFQDNTGPSYAINNENEYGAKHQNYYPTKPAAPISDQDIKQVLQRLIDRGYVSDENFARYYIENRNTKKGISTKRLRLELRQKGIADHLIEQVLAENPRNQSEEIQKMIDKKRRRGYDDQKLIQYLLRQGFDYELARNSVLSGTD